MIAVFPNLLVIAAYILGWIPESLSWLLCKNKVAQAKETLASVARVNGRDLQVLLLIFHGFERWCSA